MTRRPMRLALHMMALFVAFVSAARQLLRSGKLEGNYFLVLLLAIDPRVSWDAD